MISDETVFSAVDDGAYSVEQIIVWFGFYNTEENAIKVRASLQRLRKAGRIEHRHPSGWKVVKVN